MKRITSALCVVFALSATFAGAAIDLNAIKPNGFSRAAVFTIDGYAGSAPLTNFPVLVRISEAGISGFDYDDMNFPSTGDDLGFVDAEGNGLAFDIDTWDSGNNATSLVWVTLPVMTNGTKFAMCYRSSKSGKMVFDGNAFTNYVGVWHLNEAGDGKQSIQDASPNALSAESTDWSLAKSDGRVGAARQVAKYRNKSEKGIKVTQSASALAALDKLGTNFVASLWMRPIGTIDNDDTKNQLNKGGIGYDGIIGRKNGSSTPAWQIQLRDNPNELRIWSSETVDDSKANGPARTGVVLGFVRYEWGKLDVVYACTNNMKKYEVFWNGASVKAGDLKSVPGPGTLTLTIGGYTGTGERPFLGDMDEVRIGPFLPSPDWIRADYDQVMTASFLSAGTVEEFVEIPKPVAAFRLDDSGAAFAQFGGSISALGEGATAASVLVQVWPTAGTAPGNWTTLATGLDVGDSFEGIVTNLTPQTAYTYAIKAVNNLATPYDSDVVTNQFTTSGAGEAGTGGNARRIGDSVVHTFPFNEAEGIDTYEFVPPSYATSVEALVVAGGGPGGYYAGAGGGAGGLIYNAAFPVAGGSAYTITVGAGGVASTFEEVHGTSGGNSLITSDGGMTTNAIAFGGGAGGNGKLNGQTVALAGVSGGSGGGAAYLGSGVGNGVSGQGFAGGDGNGDYGTSNAQAGGGGGASAPGGDVSWGATRSGGSGGDGKEYDISGVAQYYAGGGGGGGVASGSPGGGGRGGGGDGGMFTVAGAGTENACAGTDGLGGGGGGGSAKSGSYVGGDGGDGIVIIRYPIQGDGTTMPNPAVALTSASYDAETGKVSFSYRVAWAGYGYQVADVGIAWGYSPSALSTTNTIATDKIGSGSGTVQLPNVSKTVYLRAVATNKGGYADDSVETAVFTLYNPDAPVGTVDVSSVAVTSATFAVGVTDLGTGASGASVTVEVCTSYDFTGTILTFPATTELAGAGTVSVEATGLLLGTTYYVRAVVENSLNVELTTDPVEFTTIAPGFPSGSGVISEICFASVFALVRSTGNGLGGTETTRWIEVSEDENFTMLVGTSTSYTGKGLNSDSTVVATGLSPDTAYHVRLAISNEWGRIAYTRLNDITTRNEPFAVHGPAWVYGDGVFDFSLQVDAVYDGAECAATLTYGGVEIGTVLFNDPEDNVSWGNVPAASDGAVAQIVVTATVDGFPAVTRTFTASIATGTGRKAVRNLGQYASAATALWLRPGDEVSLPTTDGSISYESLNERFATIDGNLLTAHEPGIVGIRFVTYEEVTNVMGVVILPDQIGNGSIYVFDETKHGNNNTAYSWSKPNCWVKAVDGVRVANDTGCPTNADDIAILPFYSATYGFIRHLTDITVGGLYVGKIRPDANIDCVLERYKDVSTKTVTFQRTDGGTVHVKVCPNGKNGSYSAIQFGGWPINVAWVGDILIDGCSSETDVNGPRGLIKFKEGTAITNTVENATITVQGLPGYNVNNANGTTRFFGVWKGTGEIVKKGQGSIVFPDDFSGFSGIVRDATGPTIGNIGAPAAGILMRAAGASNVTAHVYGYGAYNHDSGAMSYNGLSRGTLGTGGASVGPERSAQGPAKGLHLHGGTYRANNIDNAEWGVGVKDEKAFDVLGIGAGFSYISMQNGAGNGNGKPINAVTAKTLAQADKGTLAIYDHSLNNNARQTATNSMFSVLDWATHAIGGEGYGENGVSAATDDFTIIPWIIANGDSSYSWLQFPAVDANGRLVKPVRDRNKYIDTANSTNANAICEKVGNTDYSSLSHGTATNITINSLCLSNATGGDKWLGAGRTLILKSGGLILQEGAAIGLPGRVDNGNLVLGDTTHPAYVWNKCWGAKTNQIWATVSAPGGFVSTYTGNLALGGDQRGIADELVVNSGTLALGSGTNDCVLAKNLPVRVSTGATLILTHTATLKRNPVYLDSVGDVSGRIDLSGVESASVRKLLVRDLTQGDEWTALRSGTYGSSGSDAAFVRDDLFVGNGILNVSGTQPSVIILQ